MFIGTNGTIRLVTVHSCTEDETKNTSCLIIDNGFRHLAILNHLKIGLTQIIIVVTEVTFAGQAISVRTHFNIQSIQCGFFGIVGTSPIGYYNAIKLPILLQNLIQHPVVMTSMLTMYLVVGSHNTPRATLDYSCFESRQIDFVQSTFAELYINVSTPCFLIIQCIMLYTSSYTIFLHFLNIRNYHDTGQIRVFAHILKITSVEWSTINVHTGT